MLKKTIKIPIFKGDLILIKYDTTEELDAKYKLNIPYAYGAVAFSDHEKDGYTRYVFAMRQINTWTIAHESLHIAQMIMRDRGMEKHEIDETEAYILEWVFKQAEKFFIK